jgi:hypothetical protein
VEEKVDSKEDLQIAWGEDEKNKPFHSGGFQLQ